MLELLFDNRSEPIWFKFLRGFFVIILSLTVLKYSIDKFHKINNEASLVLTSKFLDGNYILFLKFIPIHLLTFFFFKTEFKLNMSLCTSPYNKIFQVQLLSVKDKFDTTFENDGSRKLCQSITLFFREFYVGFKLDVRFNNNTDTVSINSTGNQTEGDYNYFDNHKFTFDDIKNIQNIPNNTLYLIFESLRLTEEGVYFSRKEEYDEKSNSYSSFFSKMLSFDTGEAFYIDIEPNIYKSRIGNSALSLDHKLPVKLTPDQIQLVIKTRSETYQVEEVEIYSRK